MKINFHTHSIFLDRKKSKFEMKWDHEKMILLSVNKSSLIPERYCGNSIFLCKYLKYVKLVHAFMQKLYLFRNSINFFPTFSIFLNENLYKIYVQFIWYSLSSFKQTNDKQTRSLRIFHFHVFNLTFEWYFRKFIFFISIDGCGRWDCLENRKIFMITVFGFIYK
jgi:hypothetical protein